MGKRARDLMIRDRFIAAQRNCGMRRHLDGVSSDTPIREIVNSCRVWASHSDLEPSSDTGQDLDPLGESDDSRMSPDGFAGAPGVLGNGLASASIRGWC